MLAAQNLIRTAKGAGGGSYVTLPSVDHISDFLSSNINLLTGDRDLTARGARRGAELLEIPAARLAAERRREEDLDRLRSAIPLDAVELDTRRGVRPQRRLPHDDHRVLRQHAALHRRAAHLLDAQHASHAFDAREALLPRHPPSPRDDSRGDGGGRSRRCRLRDAGHLEYLVPFYEKAWRSLSRRRTGS